MTNWEEEFRDLWKELVDWAGAGFRYDTPEFTGKGLDVMKVKFEVFIREVRKQAIAEVLDAIPDEIEADNLRLVAIINFKQSLRDRFLNK